VKMLTSSLQLAALIGKQFITVIVRYRWSLLSWPLASIAGALRSVGQQSLQDDLPCGVLADVEGTIAGTLH